ncbi:MAG: methylated-DNA--[protein]-cysteine S-methyltransferase [Planctomycetaceae bacterium]|nr:methylated-DNA--[protein]-cysteine S-methyltransferase [Planctomycetaceae bacterium]
MSHTLYYSSWNTPWGAMGALAHDAIVRIILPHDTRDKVRRALLAGTAHAREDVKPFTALIELTQAYFDGAAVDFSPVACQLSAGAFRQTVLDACRTIGYGRTESYATLARWVGNSKAARAVAGALAANPVPLVVPCHRVICSDGSCGGFSAAGGVPLKRRMLELEGHRS